MELRAGPLGLTYENGALCLEGKELAPDVRKAGDMRDVMYDEAFANGVDEKLPLYKMYRNLMPHLETAGIRYDVTVISETKLGREFNKTLGHYHPIKSAGRTYAEIYEVLFGEAHYLMQKPVGGALADVVLVKAKAGVEN
ncbi:MAG: hypothetical protein NT157_01235 [Candidatus Micrarchaeota archaeon]|nr:hypothetical protein [Candidatus Micrarchaeota archaeon]